MKHALYKVIKRLCLCGLVLQGMSNYALAQNIPFVTDVDRIPTDFVYEPIEYKGLLITPQLKIGTEYNTNIFATDNNEQSDIILKTEPSLQVKKEFGTATFLADVLGKFEGYKDFQDENRASYIANLSYSNDFSSKWAYGVKTTFSDQARSRSDPTGLATSSEPLYITTMSGEGKVTRTFNRLSLTLLGRYDRIENEDGVSAANNAVPVINSINDRHQYSGEAVLLYEITPSGDIGTVPQKAVYLRGGYALHDYDEDARPATLSRDRTRANALLGFIGNFAGLSLSTDIGIGYLGQFFKESAIQDTHDLDLFAKIKYIPDPKHIISFDADRQITEDSTFITGITETNLRLAHDYEILHDWYLDSSLVYEINDFDTGRKDEDYSVSFGLQHYLSPRLSSKVFMTHTTRNSTDANQNFDRNVFMLQLTGRL